MAKKKIYEAPPIDYGDSPERMDPEIERKISAGKTPFEKHPGFPKLKPTAKYANFEEIIASKRFRDVVEKVKQYTGARQVSGRNALQQLMMAMGTAFRKVQSIESRNKEQLERLAVDLVIKEMGVPENAFQYDVKLVQMGEIDLTQMAKQSETPDEEEIEQEFGIDAIEEMEDFMTSMEKFDLEKAKRRFINALIQGSAKKSHYMFVLVKDELDRIDPQLLNLYGVIMSVNDLLYWVLPDEMVQMAAGSGEMGGGSEEIDETTDPPTIKVRGLTFPILVHELVKGVMDVIGTQGLPDEPRQAEMIMGETDTLPNEIWDLRFGPVLWEKLTEMYPDELFEEGKKHIQHYLFSRLSRLTAKEFFALTKKIMRGDDEAKQIIQRMSNEIISELKKADLEGFGFDSDEDEDEDNLAK